VLLLMLNLDCKLYCCRFLPQLTAHLPGPCGIAAALNCRNELIAGMVAGFLCKIVEYPIDTLKVQVQTHARWPPPPPPPPPSLLWPCIFFLTLVRRCFILLSVLCFVFFSFGFFSRRALFSLPLSVLAEGKIDLVGVLRGVRV
jgi:hypothetical protein